MRHIVIACLTVLFGTAAEPIGPIVEEFWEVAHLEGVKVGSLHTTVRTSAGEAAQVLRTTTDLELTLRRGNATLRLRMEQGSEETRAGS